LPAIEDVITSQTHQEIIPRASPENVGCSAANQDVITASGRDILDIPRQITLCRSNSNDTVAVGISSRAEINPDILSATGIRQKISSFSAIDDIISSASINNVIPFGGTDYIISPAPINGIITIAGVDLVGNTSSDYNGITISGKDDILVGFGVENPSEDILAGLKGADTVNNAEASFTLLDIDIITQSWRVLIER
jgi:hypothetical protein